MKRQNRQQRNIRRTKFAPAIRGSTAKRYTHSGYNNGRLNTSKTVVADFGNRERYITCKVEADHTLSYKYSNQDSGYTLTHDPTQTRLLENVYDMALTLNDGDTGVELKTNSEVYQEYRIASINIEFIPLIADAEVLGIHYLKYLPYQAQVPLTQELKKAWLQNQDPIFMLGAKQHRNLLIKLPTPTGQYSGDSGLNNWRTTDEISSGLPLQVGTLFYETDIRTIMDSNRTTHYDKDAYRMQCRFVFQFRKPKFIGSIANMRVNRTRLQYNKIQEMFKNPDRIRQRSKSIIGGLNEARKQVLESIKLARNQRWQEL